MSIKKKKKLYDFSEICLSPISLINLEKEDLLDIIHSLNTNIKAHKQREEVIRARLTKCYDYFTKIGLTDSEINKITKLGCELR